jgi:hypothetical protein
LSSDELPFTHDRPSRDPSVEVVLPLAHAEQSLTVVLALTRAVLDAISVRPHVAARLAADRAATAPAHDTARLRTRGEAFAPPGASPIDG